MDKSDVIVRRVSAHYGKIQALHEARINQGEIVTLIKNGAGKPRHRHAVATRATSGRIIL